jgi:hypothetical protein
VVVPSTARGGETIELGPDELRARAHAGSGTLRREAPPADRLKLQGGTLLLFKPGRPGGALTVRVPVPQSGPYRVSTRLVFGPWRDGRYGLYRLKADGVVLDRHFHGWYGRGTTPPYRLTWKNWGAVFLRQPSVTLTFEHDPARRGELLGIERLRLEPVAEDALSPEERQRRVPERPKAKPTDAAGAPLPPWFVEDPGHYVLAETTPASEHPIPQKPVTRATYLGWCERSGHIERDLRRRDHGPYGPRHALPSLAKFVASGERQYGQSVKEMLRNFHQWLKQQVEAKGMNSQYMHAPTCIGLELRHLRKGGLITPKDEKWIREMVLRLCRTVHVWGTPPTHWRGPMHRAQGEGVMKWLAVQWFPDAPEADAWRDYATKVWHDFWDVRDNPPNDTGYYFGILFPIALGVELMERTPSGQTPEEFFNDPAMRRIWDRLALTVSPDGLIVPYGAHGGWDSTAAQRIWTLELAAKYTGDGRYRFAAHRLMNGLLYYEERFRTYHILDGPFSTEQLAIAYLVADDSIPPVPLDPASCVLSHKETLRVNGKEGGQHYLKALDPAPDRAHICCNLIVTDKDVPFKLVFRSGWAPGDLFMLVDLFPRHEPMNPTGILGLTRHSVPFTQAISSKAVTDHHNMVMVEDLSGTATPVTNPNPHTVDAYYQQVAVERFADRKLATHAVVKVTDYTGFPMTQRREFFFVKNRFVVVRDASRFRERFLARVGPVWRTQRVAAAGEHWLNTYIAAPVASGNTRLNSLAVDLLVWHAPKEGARLEVLDQGKQDRKYAGSPLRTRYAWQGIVEPDQPLRFLQLYLPHDPRVPGRTLAEGIEVVLDAPGQTVLRLAAEKGREEWIVLNTPGKTIKTDALTTDARQLYLDLRDGKPQRAMLLDGTHLTVAGKSLWKQDKRGDWVRE